MTPKDEYIQIFNYLKTRWRRVNVCPFSNGFIDSQLIEFINSNRQMIARLGELHRELGVVKIKTRSIEDLKFADYNPRTLSEYQFKALSDSIKSFGFVEPVVVNTYKGRKDIIVGGHQRVRVAKSLGFGEVPTVEVNLPLKQEKELNVRLNKNTGEFDYDVLANEFELDDLVCWGFNVDDFSFLCPSDEDLELSPKEPNICDKDDECYCKLNGIDPREIIDNG